MTSIICVYWWIVGQACYWSLLGRHARSNTHFIWRRLFARVSNCISRILAGQQQDFIYVTLFEYSITQKCKRRFLSHLYFYLYNLDIISHLYFKLKLDSICIGSCFPFFFFKYFTFYVNVEMMTLQLKICFRMNFCANDWWVEMWQYDRLAPTLYI